jgi:ComF family protein
MRSVSRAALGAAERWLLPGACLLCHEVAGGRDDPLVCQLCRARWRRLPEPQCRRCGQPTFGVEECRLCPDWPAGFERARSAVWLDPSARQAVHLLKYEGWWRLAEVLADTCRAAATEVGGDLLIAVPLAPRRERLRGYNQAERLARALGSRLGKPLGVGLLRRSRETPSQTALAPGERVANVTGAFRGDSRVRGARVILVDDVFTTGATLAAAGDALLRAGAATVGAVTFARAVPVGL